MVGILVAKFLECKVKGIVTVVIKAIATIKPIETISILKLLMCKKN